MVRPYNFGPGPAQLPEEVLKKASEEMLNWNSTGMSCMELGHRGQDFRQIISRATESATKLLNWECLKN